MQTALVWDLDRSGSAQQLWVLSTSSLPGLEGLLRAHETPLTLHQQVKLFGCFLLPPRA